MAFRIIQDDVQFPEAAVDGLPDSVGVLALEAQDHLHDDVGGNPASLN